MADEDQIPCEDDGEICTDDYCVGGVCAHPPRAGGTWSCLTDENPCTEDVCEEGECAHNPTPNLLCYVEDESPCTFGKCDAAGICQAYPNPTANGLSCEDGDGNPCTEGQCSDGDCVPLDLCDIGEFCCAEALVGAEAEPTDPTASQQRMAVCCADPCNACLDNGSLSGGVVNVNPPYPCVGDTVTCTASGVVDSGGQKRHQCQVAPVFPGEIVYSWTVTRPGQSDLTGTGPVATFVPDREGTYTCSFVASSTRECAPALLALPLASINFLRVPLGMSVAATGGPACYRVYMPTRWGGKLDVQTTTGTVTDLAYPDGSPYANYTETGEDKHGWYTFKVVGAANYTVSTLFTQEGESTTRPWNFYWWSSNPPLLNLYESTGPYQPLVKYDVRHGTTARAWEAAHHNTPVDWCGHCLGGSIASIKLAQPTPVAGSAYNRDELEGLWSELGENAEHALDQNDLFGVPPGPPVPGPDGTDNSAPILHNTLEKHVKSARIPIYAQLRADGGAVAEVWNHAVFKFTATFEEAPGDDPKVVKITNLVTSNDDHVPPTDDAGTRDSEYVYIITYSGSGIATVVAGPGTDWISVGGDASFAPEILARVLTPSWAANNPHVIEANVRADDAGNQGN